MILLRAPPPPFLLRHLNHLPIMNSLSRRAADESATLIKLHSPMAARMVELRLLFSPRIANVILCAIFLPQHSQQTTSVHNVFPFPSLSIRTIRRNFLPRNHLYRLVEWHAYQWTSK